VLPQRQLNPVNPTRFLQVLHRFEHLGGSPFSLGAEAPQACVADMRRVVGQLGSDPEVPEPPVTMLVMDDAVSLAFS